MNQAGRHLNQLLVPPSQRDRYQGILNAPVVLVEYGNYQCLQSGKVYWLTQAIQQHFAGGLSEEKRVCVVFRHFINAIHPQAQKAAEVAEAAAAQGQFWQMHDLLFTQQQALNDSDLVEYAAWLGLDVFQLLREISNQVHHARIKEDTESGSQSGVEAAPALFVNGVRYRDCWNIEQLMAAINAANH